MAHNIEFNEQKGTHSAVFVKEAAWHGLGTVVEGALTADEVLDKANMRYKVVKRPVKFNVGRQQHVFPGKFVISREDTDAPLGICGTNWTPLQNDEAFKFFDALIDRQEAIYHTAGVLGVGQRSWILAKMPNYIRVGVDDIIEEYVLISNMFTGHDAVEVMLTPIRVVCENTLMAALAGAKGGRKITIPHTRDILKQVEKAHEALGMFSQYSKDIEEVFNKMAKFQITDSILRTYLDELLPKSTSDTTLSPINMSHKNRWKIEEFFETGVGQDIVTAKGTLFGLYNAVTGFTSHVKEYQSETAKFKNLLIGGASFKMNQKAFDLALELVK